MILIFESTNRETIKLKPETTFEILILIDC